MTKHILVTGALCMVACVSTLAACRPEPARAPAAIEPDPIIILEGSVHLDEGVALAYRAIVAPKPAAPGEYVGTIDIPKQALSGASLERVVFQEHRRIEFELAMPGTPRWTADVHPDGTITCVFTQGHVTLPCSMRDVSARPVLAS